MTPKTKFNLIRLSIYLSGLAVIFWVIGVNVWEIREKTDTPIKTENGDFVIYTDRNYQNAKLTIEFENQIPENLTATIQKDFSIFLRPRKKGVYSEQELREKLFKNNPTQHPNGNFLKYQKDIYIIEEGQIKKLETSKILNFFDLTKKQLPEITAEEFSKIPQGKIRTYQSIQGDFPEEVLINKGKDFFITGVDGYDQVYTPTLRTLKEELDLQIIPVSDQQIPGECFKTNDQKIICDFNLNNLKLKTGDIYRLSIEETTPQPDQPSKTIKTTSLTLQANPSFTETMNEIKKIFIK